MGRVPWALALDRVVKPPRPLSAYARLAAGYSLGAALLLVSPTPALAHVKWFVAPTDPSRPGIDPTLILSARTALLVAVAAAESGPLTVFADDGGTVRELVKGDAGPNAHSVAVAPETHHIYLPLQNLNGRPVLREMVAEP